MVLPTHIPEFGIVIGTYRRDFLWAQACCASIRYLSPDVPVCLLIDGDFSTSALQKAYGVQSLYRSQIKDPFLRQVSTGYGWPKVCLLWEAPFERFLYLDADTIVWGDIRQKCALDDPWDIRFDDHSHYDPKEATTPVESTVPRSWPPTRDEPDEVLRPYVGRWFFDTGEIETHFPNFPWRHYVDQYFTSGIFGARRGAFALEEYKQLFEWKNAHPHVFKFGDQGLINFMFLRAMHDEGVRATRVPWQTESSRITYEAKNARFRIGSDGLPIPSAEPWVIHYTDFKPLLGHRVSGRPMNFFRRRAQKEVYGREGVGAEMMLKKEDAAYMGWENVVRHLAGRVEYDEQE